MKTINYSCGMVLATALAITSAPTAFCADGDNGDGGASTTPNATCIATNGVVFVGGRYLAPEYRIEAFDHWASINGELVRKSPKPEPIMKPNPSDYAALPDVPPGITETSSVFGDGKNYKVVMDYLDKCIWHYVFNDVTNRAEMVAAAMKRLPCVVDAKPFSWDAITIVWKNDQIGLPEGFVSYGIRPEAHCRRMLSPSQMKESYIHLAEDYSQYLNEGDFFLFPSETEQFPMHHGGYAHQVFPLLVSLLDTETTGKAIADKIKAQTGRELDVPFCDAVLQHKDELRPEDRERLKNLK